MEFEFVDSQQSARIKVIGLGGAGNNAINNMIASGLAGVGFVAANTDLQALDRSMAPIKLQLGANLTKGLGCGANPVVGREAALEDVDKIKEALADSDMVFITAGMGGGTGTGGAPVVAEALKELESPPLTVAVVTKPFQFEGKRRHRQAEEGVERLKEHADTILTIPNDRILAMASRGASFQEALRLADEVLLQAVKGVSDLILLPGYINLDFEDARTIMSRRGLALMGTGVAGGADRASAAAQAAISSPLLEDISIQGAQGILINISCTEDNVTLDEINEACNLIGKEADGEAEVIFGVAWDRTLEDNLRVTVIATGIGNKRALEMETYEDPVRLPSLDEVARKGEFYDRPPKERTGVQNLRDFERPSYSKYESFVFDEEDLEKPTFMRRKAD